MLAHCDMKKEGNEGVGGVGRLRNLKKPLPSLYFQCWKMRRGKPNLDGMLMSYYDGRKQIDSRAKLALFFVERQELL